MGRRILRGEASSGKASLVVSRWSLVKPDSWRFVLLGSFCCVLFLGYTSLQLLIPSQRAVSKVDLFTLREVVSQYTLDHQRSPRSFYELKIAGYLNSVPSFVDEHEVFVPVPQMQDPPIRVPLPNSSDPQNSHNSATRS
jgi:hypothetical protein